MITIGEKNQSTKEQHPSGLANLISAMQESYHIPASLIPSMTTGLEKALCGYLSEFVVEHGLSESQKSDHVLVLSEDLNDTDSVLKVMSETCRLNSRVQIQYKGRKLIDICNESGSATYQLGDINIDKLDTSALLEAWECPDIDHMLPLFQSILDQLREE